MSATDDAEFQTILFLGTGGGALLFAWGFALLKKKFLLQNIPRSPIRSLAMGLCEVSGRANAADPLRAPISGTSCVYYRLNIVKDPGSKNPRTLVYDERGTPFALDDGTGTVLVDPRGAEFAGSTQTFQFSGGASKMPVECQAYFAEKGFAEKELGFIPETFSVQEWACPVGQPLFVLGAAAPPPDDDGARYRAVFSRDPAATVLLVSAESRAQYLAGLDWQVWLGLIGGPLITLACLAGLLASFTSF